MTPIDVSLFIGTDEGAECDPQLHEAYRSVLGAVAWTVLTRVELAVYVQASQRRAHAPRMKDCKRSNVVIRYMQRHTCGLNLLTLQHPPKLVASTDAAFKAQPEEQIGLAPRGLAAVLCEYEGDSAKPHGDNGEVVLVDVIVRPQCRVVRSTFSAALNGCVDRAEQMLLLQCTLHQIYCGTAQSPERMIDLLDRRLIYPPVDICVDARAVYDAISASDACERAGSSLKLHRISVRDRTLHGLIRGFVWVDT